jgi:NADP-dependent 3-hydroxy acid dehydrogenase YdfG
VQGLLYVTQAALSHLLRAAEDSPRRVADLVNISSTAGRVARPGTAVYSLTKFGVNAFSEALRQEVAEAGIRVTLIEPGAVATELPTHNRPEVLAQMRARFKDVTPLEPQDIANAIVYALGQPANVSINEVLVRPTQQVR